MSSGGDSLAPPLSYNARRPKVTPGSRSAGHQPHEAAPLDGNERGRQEQYLMTVTRHDFTAGLRELADILDDNPELPLPFSGTTSGLLWIASGGQDDHRDAAAAFTRAIPGTLHKKVRDNAFDLSGNVQGVRVNLIVDRDAVCSRVVVGTEQVTIPATPATDAAPEQTVEREIVRWDCAPILGERASA